MRAPWTAVFRAEWASALRDKRALVSALIFPLVGPILVGALFTSVADNFSADVKVSIHVEGAQHAPGFIEWVAQRGVSAKPVTVQRRAEIVAEGGAVLVVDPAYASRLEQGQVAQMRLVADFARPKTAAEAHRIRALVQGYSAQIVTMRLVLRGVSPTTLKAIELQEDDLATPQHHAANVLHVVPLFVILACFIGGMQVAIDVTAGERERGSLEALLITPASTHEIALGKWLVTIVFGAMSAVLTLLLSIVSLRWAPLESLGIHGGLGVDQAAHLLLVIAPLVPFAAGMQLYLSTFARSFREAQTWLSLLLFVPMVPGFIATVSPIDPQTWMMAVPALAQQVMISDALRGEVVDWLGLTIAAASSTALTAAALWATGRAFRREGILFPGQ